MINLETLLGIAGAFGGLEALKWLFSLRSNRRKGDAEAADSVENVVARRLKTYEDSILFLQNRLEEKERQFTELSDRYRQSMEKGINLTQKLGELKLKYGTSRCDVKDCENRKPPFRWMKKKGAAMVTLMIMLTLAACTRNVYIPVETRATHTDSVYSLISRTDTIIRLDSVILQLRGDTVVKEVWRVRNRISTARDTVYLSRADTVRIEKPIVAEGRGSQGNRSAWGWIAAATLLALLIILYRFGRK